MDVMKRNKPIFGTLSLIVPVLGLALAYLAARNAPPSSGDNWTGLITLAFYGALSVSCGFILAGVGLLRRERLSFLSWFGLILNLVPIVWLLDKAELFPVWCS